MPTSFKLNVTITKDHVIKVPDEIPEGSAEVIVTVAANPKGEGRRPIGLDAASGITVPDDFNAPLPLELQRLFEGNGV